MTVGRAHQKNMYSRVVHYHSEIFYGLCSALLWTLQLNVTWDSRQTGNIPVSKPSIQLCHRKSLNTFSWVTNHTVYLQPNMSHTYLYSSVAQHHYPLAGSYCTYPWMDGQAELTWLSGNIQSWYHQAKLSFHFTKKSLWQLPSQLQSIITL